MFEKVWENCTEDFHWPYMFIMCVLILHTAVSVGTSMFYTEVLDPVLGVTRTCWKQRSEGNVLNFLLLGGKSTWVAAVSSWVFFCELDVNELQPGVQRCAPAQMHHLSSRKFGHGVLWLVNGSCTAGRQPWTQAHRQNCPASHLLGLSQIIPQFGDKSSWNQGFQHIYFEFRRRICGKLVKLVCWWALVTKGAYLFASHTNRKKSPNSWIKE